MNVTPVLATMVEVVMTLSTTTTVLAPRDGLGNSVQQVGVLF